MSNSIKNRCAVCCFEFEIPLEKRNQKTCSKDCSYKLRISVRNTKHEPIEKTCKECSQIFQDTSKKKLVETCIDCVHTKMVNTRKERGSYERTEAQNEKLSRTLKKKYELGWNPNTEEHRAKLSKIMKEAWASGDFSKKSKETCIRKYKSECWTKSKAGREKLSILFKNRKFSLDTRQKMSKSASIRIRLGKQKCFTNGNGYFREDLDCYFRSNWEANFARICNFEGMKWEYEPETFTLKSGKTYTPDFKVEDTYFEIKGRWLGDSKEKFENFILENAECKINLVDGKIYKQLRSKYKHLITWEGK